MTPGSNRKSAGENKEEKRLKRQRRDFEMEMDFMLANPVFCEYESRAIKSLESHLNGYAQCVEEAGRLKGIDVDSSGIEEFKAILDSDAFVDVIAGAVQFKSAIDMLKLTKQGKKYKKKHLRRHVGRMVLRRGNLTESAMRLWESNGAWALEQFREFGIATPSWAHLYLNVRYPNP